MSLVAKATIPRIPGEITTGVIIMAAEISHQTLMK
jgi:hypothetical protein